MEHERKKERERGGGERGTMKQKGSVCEDGRRSSRVRRTERDRKPPGTSLGTGAMSHLSYYSHSPRPDLRQTNNLSPTAATVATSLLPFSVLLSAIPSPPSLFHLALMGFVLVVYIYMCVCTTPSPAGAKPFSFTTARATGPGYLCKRQLTWGNPERAINSAACRRVVSLLMRWSVVELGFRAGKMRFRFASYAPRSFLCTCHIEFFRILFRYIWKWYRYFRFLICEIGINVRFVK